MFRGILLVALLAVAGCAADNPNRAAVHVATGEAQKQAPATPAPRPPDPTGFHLTPVQFLASLRLPAESPERIVLIFDKNPGWIRDEDIALLMTHLDSQARCAHVKVGISSHDPSGFITEGTQAAFLIEGFRRGNYPPELDSGAFKPDMDELRRWYRQWRASRPQLQ